ncbi:MAG: phage tail-type lysozyme domain-containing protein [Clostridiales bacterium]|nr:phage tail-type lysozyme domain-containing protein [Clostridiales bacterium]
MKAAHRLLSFVLALSMTVTLLPVSPVLAAETSSVAAAESTAAGTVTGFGELETQEIALAEKIDLDALLESMPSTLPVYLDNSSEVTEIPVTWYCLDDYETSNDYYFQFSPSWDTDAYPLLDGLDVEVDAPYIAVYLAGVTAMSSSSSTVSGNSNETTIFTYLTGTMGLNTAAACGILANMYAESAFKPTSSCTDSNGLTSYGLCQWNGSRYTKLKSWCNSNGYNYKTVTGQLHFLSYELSTSTYNYILKYLQGVSNSASGAYNAGYYWCYYFEQPANTTTQSKTRGNLAKNSYWPFYSALVSASNSSASSASAPVLSDYTTPGTSMTYGTLFTLKGTITASSAITSVTAGVYNSSGKAVTSASATPNSTAFDVYELDEDVLFSQVPVGSYTYVIKATVGGTTYTVLDYSFKVTARKLSNATISSIDARYTYTGSSIKPTPKVKYSGTTLTKGTDYTLSYSSNKSVGTATITIKGTGNYTGTVKKTFKIVPKKVSNLKVKSSSSKKITVTWTALKSVRGYQIQYSTSSDFSNAKTVTVVGTTNKKKVISSLKSGKTYYVRIRSYCKVSGTNYYSFYSSKVKIKVK